MTAQLIGTCLQVDFNGTSYIFHALRDCDFGEFEMWAQDRYLSTVKRNITDLTDTQQSLILMNAFEKAALITFSSKEAAELMKSIEGSTRLLWLSLRKVLTLDETRILATDRNFCVKAFEKIQLLSGFNPVKSETTAKKKLDMSQEKKSIVSSRRHMGGRRRK